MFHRRHAIALSFGIGLSLIILVLGLIAPSTAQTAGAMPNDASLLESSIPAESAALNEAPANVPAGPLGFFSLAAADDAGARFQTIGANGTFVFDANAIEYLPENGRTAVVQRFVEANDRVEISGSQPQPGILNFLIGNDPDQWQTEIPIFGAIRYHNLYPGIDLEVDNILDEANGVPALRSRFLIAAGADPAQIRWRIEKGGETAALVMGGSATAWQTVGGRRQPVAAYQVMDDRGIAGFKVEATTARSPLVIEVRSPTGSSGAEKLAASNVLTSPPKSLMFSTYLSGDADSLGYSIAADPYGNSYVAGVNYSHNFPLLTPYQSSWSCVVGTPQVGFVASFSITGALRYATLLGGGCNDNIKDIAVDSAGNAYVTGWTQSIEFPLVQPLFTQMNPGYGCDYYGGGWICDADAFVAKLGPTGSTLPFSTFIGGSTWDTGEGIAWSEVMSAVVFIGSTNSLNLPIFLGDNTTDGADAYWGAISFSGGTPQLDYLSYFGGSGGDSGYGVATWEKSVYLTGQTWSSDIPLVNSLPIDPGTGTAVFAARFSFASSVATPTVEYSTYVGGGYGYAIAADGQGNAYITGKTGSPDFPVTPGAYDTTQPGGQEDAFVASLSLTGTLRYATYLGSQGRDRGNDIAVDAWGYAYVVGITGNYNLTTNFPIADSADAISNCGTSAFVAKFNRDGSDLLFSTCMGEGNIWNEGYGVATDGKSGIYVTGVTSSDSFPTTAGAFQSTPACTSSTCQQRTFVARFNTLPWTIIYYGAGDNNLTKLLQAQHSVLQEILDNPNVQVILLEDKNSGYTETVTPDSAYYILQPPSVPVVDGVNRFIQPELNTADKNTLIASVQWAKQWARANRPSRYYAFIMDDHGTGINGAMEDDGNSKSPSAPVPIMSVKDIGAALDTITNQGNDKFDVFYMLACLMGMIEDGYQWRTAADYYVASEAIHTSAPIEWSSLISTTTESTTPFSYSISVVNEYYRYRLKGQDPSTLSAVDLSQADALAQATYTLGKELANRMDTVAITLTQILTSTGVQRFEMNFDEAIWVTDDYIDLYDFAFRVQNAISDPTVQAAAQNVMDAVSGYVIYERHTSSRHYFKQNGSWWYYLWNHNNAHGVSIFFPSQPSSFYNGGNFAFVGFTPWYPTRPVVGGLSTQAAGEGWGNLLKTYVAAVYPEAPDNPNPPPLVERIVATAGLTESHQLYLPTIIR